MSPQADLTDTLTRRIVRRTRGQRHGPITRLMSPSDFGEVLKPFVFLDLFDTAQASFSGMGLHPHSGIATVTHLLEGSIRYEDTTGATGVLPEGGVEYFRAAGGAWHGGGPGEHARTRGFQLWLALPPEHELGEVESVYLAPTAVPRQGPVLVLLGEYDGVRSPLTPPSPITYLAVKLKAGETWRYQPSVGHDVAWVALGSGSVFAGDRIDAGELVAFEPSNAPIEFYAEADTEFVLGAAAPHAHDLVLGYYSVHTSAEALRTGEQRIVEIQQRLQREGRL